MTTLELSGPVTIDGTTYPAAKVIVLSPQHQRAVQPILPKVEPTEGQKENINGNSCRTAKRRIPFSKKALTHPRPQSVTRRNTRERNRIRVVNQGFVTLASHVPAEMRAKKMSKVDTLQAAILYIKELQKALEMPDGVNADSPSTSDESAASPGSIYAESMTSPGSSSFSADQPFSPDYQGSCDVYTSAPYIDSPPAQSFSYNNNYYSAPLQPISNQDTCHQSAWFHTAQTDSYSYPQQPVYMPQPSYPHSTASHQYDNYNLVDAPETSLSALDEEEHRILDMVSSFF